LKVRGLAQPGTALARQDLSDLFGLSDRDAVVYDTFPPTRPKTQAIGNEVVLPLHSVGIQPPINPLLFELSSRMLKGVSAAPEVRGVVEYVTSYCEFCAVLYLRNNKSQPFQKLIAYSGSCTLHQEKKK
jgi:hypothetical protein